MLLQTRQQKMLAIAGLILVAILLCLLLLLLHLGTVTETDCQVAIDEAGLFYIC